MTHASEASSRTPLMQRSAATAVSKDFGRKIDVTVIRISSKESAKLEEMHKFFHAWAAELGVPKNYVVASDGNEPLASRFTVRFDGAPGTAERRVDKTSQACSATH